MVDVVLRLTGAEVVVNSTPTTLNNIGYFRILPEADGLFEVLHPTEATVIGTMSVVAGFPEIVNKERSQRVRCSSNVRCTPLAYR